ncbi:MAG: hypothetical protein IJK89_05740 [Clostridia bacterium]|nr:hypothetical protein [Clostridia bacterium]
MEEMHQKRRSLLIIDIIALLVLFGLTVGYYNIIIHSVNVVDESCYLSLAHRFFLGDCPITEEWHVNQMTGILLLLPFSVFCSVMTGDSSLS